MATKRFVLALLYLITLVHAQQALLPVLRLEISNFIPGCAQQCFRSFLAVNYGLNPCGRLPSLQCLCRRRGAAGFTVSEGALQCITAERLVGSCSHFEASDAVVGTALTICDDIEDAVQPTHTVITATVVLPPSGTGAVTLPPLETTTTTTSSFSSTTRTSASVTRSSTSVSTTRKTSTRSLSSSSISSTTSSTTLTTVARPSSTETDSQPATELPSAPPPSGGVTDEANSEDSLTTPQIIGISVGAAAAVIFAIAAIFLARYYRRRKYPDVKTGFFPARDTWGYNVEKGPDNESNSWLGRHTAEGSDQDPVPQLPPIYAKFTTQTRTQTWRPSDVRTAAPTPPSSQRRGTTQTPPSRRVSKLLPAKPILQLAVANKTPSPSPSSQKSQPKRSPAANSLAGGFSPARTPPAKQPTPNLPAGVPTAGKARPPTNLKLQIPGQNNPLPPLPLAQNRRESTMTEFEEDGGILSPSGQIWRPPSAGPLSATTYYVADKNGNWILGGPRSASHVAELDGSPKLSATSPRPLPPQPLPGKPSTSMPQPATRPAQQRSLAPSADTRPAREPERARPRDYPNDNNVPRPLFSSNQNLRRQSTRRSSKSFSRPRAASNDSGVTTICTSPEDDSIRELPMPQPASTPLPRPQAPQLVFLSPVVESPKPGSSGVANPPRFNPAPIPAPSDPARHRSVAAGRNIHILPPNKRNLLYSPPGQPSPTLGSMQPAQGANKQQPTPGPPRAGARPAVRNPGLVRSGSPTMRVVRASPEADDRSQLPSVRPSRPQQPAAPSQRAPHPLSNVANMTPRHSSQQHPNPFPRPLRTSMPPPQFPMPGGSETSRPSFASAELTSPYSERTTSTGSSLLAKRVGSDRAANMAMPGAFPPAAAFHWRGDDFPAAPGMPSDLPATPTWVPRLTPTRRGDDLFLNVQ
jgi:hypothetical protein